MENNLNNQNINQDEVPESQNTNPNDAPIGQSGAQIGQIPTGQATPQGSIPISNLPKQPSSQSQPINQNNQAEPKIDLPQGNPYEPTTPQQPSQISTPEKKSPPPPEKLEDRIAIRTLKSDKESIRETGGDTPKSEIVTAPEINSPEVPEQPLQQGQVQNEQTSQKPTIQPEQVIQSEPSPIQPNQNDQPLMSEQAPPQTLGTIKSNLATTQKTQPSSQPTPRPKNAMTTPQTKEIVKTILIIFGIIILAVIIGAGVYYLISTLNTNPKPTVNTKPSNDNQLPIDIYDNDGKNHNKTNENNQNEENTFEHQSLIISPDSTIKTIIPAVTLAYIKTAIASSTTQTLSEGKVKEIIFVQKTASTSEKQIESQDLIQAFFPNIASKLTSLFDKNYTAWIYFDKIDKITPKFGLIFKLKNGVDINSATSTIADIENYPDLIANLFIDTVTTPPNPSFDDGEVNGINVRFLQFSKGNVFEYGWLSSKTDVYLIMTTSYKQMVNITSKISTK